MRKFYSAVIILLFLLPSFLIAQDKKKAAANTVCATPVPSRAAAINKSQKSSTGQASKKMACCKGAPSRFTASAPAAKK